MLSHFIPAHQHIRRDAHRAPDPAPLDEPPEEPFENFDPHQPPIRTPNNDEPPVDPNPSIRRGMRAQAWRHAGYRLH